MSVIGKEKKQPKIFFHTVFCNNGFFPELTGQVRACIDIVEDLEGYLSPAPSVLYVSD